MDAISGFRFTPSSADLWKPDGPYIAFDGSSYINVTPNFNAFNVGPTLDEGSTWTTRMRWSHTDVWSAYAGGDDADEDSYFNFFLNRNGAAGSDSGDLAFSAAYGAKGGTTGQAFNDGQWHTVSWRLSALSEAGTSLFVDGIKQSLTFWATDTTTRADQFKGFCWGARYDNSAYSNYTVVDMSLAMVHLMALPPRAIIQLHADPYAMFRPRPVPAFYSSGAVTANIQLDWTDNSEHEDGFAIERDDDGAGWVEIDTVGAGVETYDDLAVPTGVTYTYRVKAESAALGDSEWSNEAEVIV